MSNYSINDKEVSFKWGLQGSTPFETLVSEEYPDYILKVHWTLEASLDDTKVSTFGCHTFEVKPQENGDTFIPFEEITPKILFSWLGSTDYANDIKDSLVKILENMINAPKVELKSIPWLNKEVVNPV